MCDGTGLVDFSNQFPKRFFDVGIAEEHAVLFAAAFSVMLFAPLTPYVAVGAFTAGASRAGRVHVFHGGAAGVVATPAVSLTGPDGAEGLFGSSVD